MVIFCSACSSTAERACQRLTNGESAFCWEQSLQVSQVGTSPGPGNYTCTSLTIITLSYERLHSLKLSLDCPVWHKCTVWRPVTWFLICWRLWLIQVTWRRLAVQMYSKVSMLLPLTSDVTSCQINGIDCWAFSCSCI